MSKSANRLVPAESLYTETTGSVTVSALPEYDHNQSNSRENYHVWVYNINIKNNSSNKIKLISRNWKIIDSKGQIQEVEGEGVVGVQPSLYPSEEFGYTSGTHLEASSGIMMGYYTMQDDSGRDFKVAIPPFSLDSPESIKMAN